jgi:hypothetical protein
LTRSWQEHSDSCMNPDSIEHSVERLLHQGTRVVLLVAVCFALSVSMAACFVPPETGLPSTGISPIQTPIRAATEATLTPQPTIALKQLPTSISDTLEPLVLVPIPGSTLAGAGAIVKIQPPFSSNMYHIENTWYTDLDSERRLYVYAGSVSAPGGGYTDQGIVIVHILGPGSEFLCTGQYLTPQKMGPVRIDGAVGDRLILQSTQGARFYFDATSRQFVPSLTWVSPIVTPSAQPTKPSP